MEKRIRLSIASLAIASVSSAVWASPILYEPFNYNAPARVLGQANASTGTSWLLAAASTAGGDTTSINVAPGSLTPAPAAFQPPVGNSASITGNGNLSGASNRLAFFPNSAQISTGSIFFSMALRVDDLSGSNTTVGGFFFGLNNTGNSATTTNPSSVAAKLQMRIDPTDGTKYQLAVFNNHNASSTASFWTSGLNVGDTIFLVGSYDIGAQVSKLWVNPDPFNPSAPETVSDTVAGTAINIASILLRQSPAPFLTLDEIRVGTSWADVAPEPTTLVMLTAATFALLRRRSRRA